MIKEFIKHLLYLTPRINTQYECNSEHYGSSYGGWVVCPDYLSKDSIIYSFGVGKDISFDISLIHRFNCSVYGFDPTPKSIEWINKQELPSNYHFYPIGISNKDGSEKFKFPSNPDHVSFKIAGDVKENTSVIECPVKRISTIMYELGHDWVDVVKLDVEGAEFNVLNDMMKSNIFPKQILVEFHYKLDKDLIEKTELIVKDVLFRHGYRAFYCSPSNQEISFIKKF